MRLLALALFTVVAAPALAANDAVFFQSIPTLDEVGLAALIALVAGVAGWAAGRRSRR
jgi:hypothetical protein